MSFTEGDTRWIKRHTQKTFEQLYGKKRKGDNMHIGTIKSPNWDKEMKKLKNPIVDKLLKLKYRINDMYRNGGPGVDTDMTRDDKTWVMTLISDVRNNDLAKLSREDGLKCNELWRKYEAK